MGMQIHFTLADWKVANFQLAEELAYLPQLIA